MKLRFTDHAQYRLYERGITPEQIKLVIRSPDWKIFKDNGKVLHVKRFRDKTISIVSKVQGNIFIIISLF
jgi:hypothetical protein